jgi:threonine/homoserine/homoserine lactone efflux protein
MPMTELLALLLLATAMSFTPGPNTLLAAALAANHGFRHALRFVLGVPVGWCLVLLACSLGLGALVTQWPSLRWGLKWLGLAYLLWLAWSLARRRILGGAGPGTLGIGFQHGVLLQFVNIKAWMAALMISGTFITVATPMAPRLLFVLPILMAFGLASNLAYAGVGASLRGWLGAGERLLWFNRSMALVLLATVAWMAGL